MPPGDKKKPKAAPTTKARPRRIEVMQADGRIYSYRYSGTNAQLRDAIKAGVIPVEPHLDSIEMRWVVVRNAIQVDVAP